VAQHHPRSLRLLWAQAAQADPAALSEAPAAKSIAFRPPFFTFEDTTALALSCLVPTLFFGKTTAA